MESVIYMLQGIVPATVIIVAAFFLLRIREKKGKAIKCRVCGLFYKPVTGVCPRCKSINETVGYT